MSLILQQSISIWLSFFVLLLVCVCLCHFDFSVSAWVPVKEIMCCIFIFAFVWSNKRKKTSSKRSIFIPTPRDTQTPHCHTSLDEHVKVRTASNRHMYHHSSSKSYIYGHLLLLFEWHVIIFTLKYKQKLFKRCRMLHILKLSSTKWQLNRFMFLKQPNSRTFLTWAEILNYNIYIENGFLFTAKQPVHLLMITVEH